MFKTSKSTEGPFIRTFSKKITGIVNFKISTRITVKLQGQAHLLKTAEPKFSSKKMKTKTPMFLKKEKMIIPNFYQHQAYISLVLISLLTYKQFIYCTFNLKKKKNEKEPKLEM